MARVGGLIDGPDTAPLVTAICGPNGDLFHPACARTLTDPNPITVEWEATWPCASCARPLGEQAR